MMPRVCVCACFFERVGSSNVDRCCSRIMVDIFNRLSSLLCPYFNEKVSSPHAPSRRPVCPLAFVMFQYSGGMDTRGMDEPPQNFNDGVC
jgi:hypothetical protein